MIRRPPRSTLFPTRRSSDLHRVLLVRLAADAATTRDSAATRVDPGRRPRVLPCRRARSEEHTSELQSPCNLVCRLLLEKKKNTSTCVARTTRDSTQSDTQNA